MAMYEDTTCCLMTAEGNSRKFPIPSGVKQGCVPSSLLFAIVTDFVLRSIDSTGVRLNDRLLSDLDSADGIGILETCKSRLQALLTNIQQKAEGFGLNINVSKTKGVSTSDSPINIKWDDNNVEQVVHFKYFGCTIENTESTAKEVIARTGQASSTFNRLKKVWRSSTFSLWLKLSLLNSNVLPVLL
ncbi:uncharacterized protein LOC136041987 [Artemia franciscana]|uniref:uncharacterized protein LOC136041987 n=1 Tax=Artemia franciscana TaxID=6661 RepID=UPI0032DAB0F1